MVQYISPIPAVDWPQDTNQVPGPGSGMPPVEFTNRYVNGAEAFSMTAQFDMAASLPSGSQFNVILPTDQDGDFWVDQIFTSGYFTTGGVQTSFLMPSMLSIQDIRTGRFLTYSGSDGLNQIPIQLFESLYGTLSQTNYSGDLPIPQAFRASGTLIQPYCFTRQGGIKIGLTTIAPGQAGLTISMNVVFAGWKEYANASR